MLIVKKINFSPKEIKAITKELEGYIWLAVDVSKGIIAAGDEYVVQLKQALFKEKCFIFNIFGTGLNLTTGEIDYISPINRKYIDKNSTKYVPDQYRDRIETLIQYFFTELPVFKFSAKQRFARYLTLPNSR